MLVFASKAMRVCCKNRRRKEIKVRRDKDRGLNVGRDVEIDERGIKKRKITGERDTRDPHK